MGSEAGGTLWTEYRGIQNSRFLRPALYVLLAEPTELAASALSGDACGLSETLDLSVDSATDGKNLDAVGLLNFYFLTCQIVVLSPW